jgi:hypothetical protein
MKMTKRLFVPMLVLAFVLSIFAVPSLAAPVSGAIFTTDSGGSTNINLYDAKTDVYLNGGPRHEGAAGLPDGDYYVQVTSPNGIVLGTSVGSIEPTPVHVMDGSFEFAYRLWDIVFQAGDQPGYADTPNNGGVYKVWVSKDPGFAESASKTDNFRVKMNAVTYNGAISGYKFNDLNFNGADDMEPRLEFWEINLYMMIDGSYVLIDTKLTAANGSFQFTQLAPGAYKVTETLQDHWMQTAPAAGHFLVNLGANETVNNLAFGNTENGRLIVRKFYDSNGNGTHDDGEPWLVDWKINISGGIGDKWTPYDAYIKHGSYTVTEYMPIEPGWMATTPNPVMVDLDLKETETVTFGNLLLGNGGGLTLGFWSNRNGAKLFGADDLAAMVALNLRNEDGSDFDPASYNEFRSWLLSANATNMANMLSAQLAAMKLNVLNGKVDEDSFIYVGPNSYTDNIIKISDLIAWADASLGSDGFTPAGHDQRSYQDFLKSALDMANNNKNFVQPPPAPGSYSFS